ncbi:MAG: MopE-related protein [Myxococcota bacterium]
MTLRLSLAALAQFVLAHGCPSPECGPDDRYVDADGDGFGAGPPVTECVAGTRYAPLDDDCDDGDAAIAPSAEEVCDGIDNDCNGFVDEGAAPLTWYVDEDGDGFGAPDTGVEVCEPPGEGWTRRAADCDDTDSTTNPSAEDLCDDGIDQDCDGADTVCGQFTTCLAIRDANPEAPSGPYTLVVDGESYDVHCDMDTDGGGWTLVASSFGQPLRDSATVYHDELQTLFPTSSRRSVWSGLRGEVGPVHDLRFVCKVDVVQTAPTVDLSFYDVPWYLEITNGGDADSCFSEDGGRGALVPPPARTNNVTGVSLPLGDQWDRGFLEGEYTCSSLTDFTVDFDDRGMDATSRDQSDWGEDDREALCGTVIEPEGAAWFLLVR